MRKVARSLAVVAVAALVLSGCGRGSTDTGNGDATGKTGDSGPKTAAPVTVQFPKMNKPNVKACMVSDSGGFDDRSFNETSRAGLTNAAKDFGIQQRAIESHSDADYVPNINALVKQNCDEITTVGFLLADATLAAAKKNPKIDFSIVDNAYKPGQAPKNLKALVFDTASPSFLAGYLAAGMSKSGYVGTYGGVPIPTVTIYMDGFWEGVQYYNKVKHKDVKVIGWNEKTQKGSFTNDFETPSKGQTVAENMIQQGADIIFPVAGKDGIGALQAARDNNIKAIWVDTDGCVSAADYCDVLLTSVMKGMDVAVEKSIQASIQGNFSNKAYVGTLENGGVGLAPYHQAESTIPDSLKKEIDELRYKLLHGQITITSKAVPQA